MGQCSLAGPKATAHPRFRGGPGVALTAVFTSSAPFTSPGEESQMVALLGPGLGNKPPQNLLAEPSRRLSRTRSCKLGWGWRGALLLSRGRSLAVAT